MDKATRAALEGSIQKWQKIVDGTGEDEGHRNCPLCRMFIGRSEDTGPFTWGCAGCPVSASSGRPACEGTPYHDRWALIRDAQEYNRIGRNTRTPELIAAAQAELDFLIGLRPVPGTGDST